MTLDDHAALDPLDAWWCKAAIALTVAPLIWYLHWQLHGIRPARSGNISEGAARVYVALGVWGTTLVLGSLCLLLLYWAARDRLRPGDA